MVSYYGCHVSVAGGLENGIKNGVALGVNSIQVHPSPPQRWNRNPFKPGHEDAFLREREGSGIEKIFFHAIYLINLANPDPEKLTLSMLSLIHYLDLMDRIEGDGVIFHVGSMKHHEDEDEGYEHVIDILNKVLEKSPGSSRLLLEVSAGGGRVIGSSFEDLERIYHSVDQKERLGFALDTQHMWASGYDLQNDLDGVIEQIEEHFGFENIHIVHLNDSMTECGSRRDRHENVGEGLIGKKALKKFIHHPGFKEIPFVLETPALKSLETAEEEIKRLKQIVKP